VAIAFLFANGKQAFFRRRLGEKEWGAKRNESKHNPDFHAESIASRSSSVAGLHLD
jgi:hypothetical protein